MSVHQAEFSEDCLDHAAPQPARRSEGGVAGLSNDYLNHFNEPLMLIELAALDAEVITDLNEWRPVDYPRYFQASQLRRAPEARAAYDRLDADRREAFEQLVRALDQLVATAIRALRPPCEPQDAALVAAVTAPAMRRLIGQASAFLNSGGRDLPDSSEVEEAQSVIDRLLEHLGEG
jgi:hypothetical protein